ncbi:hypothetical protein Ndes2526B_g01659 [Nannochloris sp. 'desiccata']|nr:putative 26S proteasome non-ATPase regulatory subunit 9 [Chlorella desiccata (nom. nud.)]
MTTAADLKQQLKGLETRRSHLEIEVSLARARLEATGLGMDEPLVDSEGFPKANIDIGAIRSDRQKVRMLSNDHKELTTQMEIIIHRLHAMSKDTGTVSLPAAAAGGTADYGGVSHVDARPIADPLAVPSRSTHAFAEVDEVAEESPAAAAGLQIGDLMIRFAHVTSQTPNFLSAVAGALAAGEGKELEAVVLRNGEEVKLRLIPQKWEGRGLLGCHLQPLR